MLWPTLLAVSWALTGLIWTVQLVHYPSFHHVAESDFQLFHRHHSSSITWIVMPLMLLELVLSCWAAVNHGWSVPILIPLLAVVAIWGCTFFISIPLHQVLEQGKDAAVIRQLVTTNWPRTILWTAKAVWVTWLFYKMQ